MVVAAVPGPNDVTMTAPGEEDGGLTVVAGPGSAPRIDALRGAMRGHVIAEATLTATYRRS